MSLALETPPSRLEVVARTFERPIFLAGRGRSGTSLLMRLFDQHPQLFSTPGETRLLTEIVPNLRKSGDLAAAADAIALRFFSKKTDASLTDASLVEQLEALDLDDPALARSVFRIGMERWAARRDPGRAIAFLEKTPKNEDHLAELFTAFPQAKVLYLLRDPRAVFVSNSRSPDYRQGADFIARQWVKSVRRMLAYVAGQDAHEAIRVVRFEELVADPRAVMASLCAFLHLDWSDTLLTPTVRGRPWDGNSYDPTKRTPDGVAARKADEWREEIAPEDQAAIEAAAGFEMSLLGYRPG